jgi:hypothetical protein
LRVEGSGIQFGHGSELGSVSSRLGSRSVRLGSGVCRPGEESRSSSISRVTHH